MNSAPPPPANAPTPNAEEDSRSFDLVRNVEVEITLEIGRRRMRIGEVLRLGPGQTLSLAKAAGEPIDLYVNGRLFGRGEAVVAGDRYGVHITEIVGAKS